MSADPTDSASTGAADGKATVFVSYAREDRQFALRLHRALEAQGREVWADWESIADGALWESEVASGIEAADVFVLVLSPDSIVSAECDKELGRAVDHNKRLLPVLHRDVDVPMAPEVIRPVNWSDFRDADGFDDALERFADALDTDLEWVHEHTRLLERALEWDRGRRDRSRVLRGRDLQEAELWLAVQGAGGDRKPTRLHTEYIYESRRSAVRRQRIVVGAVLAALAVSVGLAVFALVQRSYAIGREKIARSRELAARSALQLQQDPAQSLTLAVHAVEAAPTVQAAEALRRALSVPTEGVVLEREASPLEAVTFSPDGKLVVTAAADGKTRVLDAGTGALVALLGNRLIQQVDSLRFSRDGRTLLATGEGLAWGWRTTDWRRIAALDDDHARSASFAPDGRLFFSTGGVTRVWNPSTGQTRTAFADRGLSGDTFPIAPAFSGDGTLAVSSSGRSPGTVVVWRVADGRPLAVIRASSNDRVASAALSPDGSRVATRGLDGRDGVWNAKTGASVAGAVGSPSEGRTSFSPDGRLVLTSQLWQASTGRTRLVLEREPAGVVRTTSFSPDGRLVVTARSDGAQLWDVATRSKVADLEAHTGSVNDAAFSRDGRLVVTAGQDGTARLWTTPADVHRTLRGHLGFLNHPELSPDGTLVVAPGTDGKARLWDAASGKEIRELDAHTGARTAATFSPDGSRIATSAVDGTVSIWETTTGRRLLVLRDRSGVSVPTFSADGSRIATIARVGAGVQVWDARTGAKVAAFRAAGTTDGTALSPDGSFVAAYGSQGHQVAVWDVANRRRTTFGGGAYDFYGTTFSPDGRLLTTSLEEGFGAARLWDLRPRRSRYVVRGDEVGLFAAFSADGKRLVTTGLNEGARVWNGETGQSVAVLRGHAGRVVDASFSGDANLVVTAGADGTARVWETETGALLATERTGRGYLESAALSADGKWILTGGEDGLVRIYPCHVCGSLANLLALARTRLLGRLP